jgi:hypothetical protein
VNPVLVLSWWYPNLKRAEIQRFVMDGDMTSLAKEVAAALSIIDRGDAFYRGIIGDLQGEILLLQQDLRDARLLEDFVLSQIRNGPLAEVARA